MEKSHAGDFWLGEPGTYALRVSNVGDAPTPDAIRLTDTLPAALANASAIGDGWTCGGEGQTATCTHPGPVEPGASLPPVTLTVDVVGPRGEVTNRVSAATAGDVDPINDTDEDPTILWDPAAGDAVKIWVEGEGLFGPFEESTSGKLPTGDVTVYPRTGLIPSVRGGGTLPDGTQVAFNVNGFLGIYFGEVNVRITQLQYDTAVLFASVRRTPGGNTATSTSSWLTWDYTFGFPLPVFYTLTWWVDDRR